MSCPQCFSGSVHEGTPKGEITKLHGLDAYVSAPPQEPAKGIVIIVPDAFGWEFVNLRLLADHYAEKGNFKVYLPDFMNGHPASTAVLTAVPKLVGGGGLWAWLAKPYWLFLLVKIMVPFFIHNRFGKVWPVVESFFKTVRENEGANLPIGVAGFCWGGKHSVVLAHGTSSVNGKPLIDAAFTGHPSMLDFPSDIEKIKIPTSFALAGEDFVVPASKIELIQKIIEAQPEETKGESKVYVGTGHGFCVRADHISVEKERAATEAEDQAVSWFLKYFAKTSY
ncbi:dienelactone hydrolase family protein [Talaromyces proteolyticus]|uniref:Dienelactone hydrolase family protein n=1 Tax=Talaromyces proteolyticus TaxID=1131652 RepID=A0AAD4KSC1_9EURO|nr:dienelactone hydrolase family protein [Talaromyces proteolyticus]KAH8698341.1 dienelactone hydrolase family protein [Talaromyces proteolyticus]